MKTSINDIIGFKIKPKHYYQIKEQFEALWANPARPIQKHMAYLKESHKYQDFDEKLVWDIYNTCETPQFITQQLYSYLTYEELIIALKHIWYKIQYYDKLNQLRNEFNIIANQLNRPLIEGDSNV